jgi:hypothetical protein
MSQPLIRPAFATGVAASLFLLAVGSGCGSTWQTYNERLVRQQITTATDAPEWVRGRIQADSNNLSFVGRGAGYNVLDERKAFDEAFMHAREQLAQYVGTRVVSESCDQDWARGARFLPLADSGPGDGEEPGQAIRSRAKQVADALVGELLPVAQYWEQWDVEEDPERSWNGLWFENEHRFDIRRYKCWVLASIPKERVEKYIAATLAMLENEAELQRMEGELAALRAGEPAGVDGAVKAALDAKEHEIMTLRERIHYGRAFRLTTKDRCATPEACTPVAHPQWRKTGLEVTTRVQAGVVPAKGSSICDGMPLEGR